MTRFTGARADETVGFVVVGTVTGTSGAVAGFMEVRTVAATGVGTGFIVVGTGGAVTGFIVVGTGGAVAGFMEVGTGGAVAGFMVVGTGGAVAGFMVVGTGGAVAGFMVVGTGGAVAGFMVVGTGGARGVSRNAKEYFKTSLVAFVSDSNLRHISASVIGS
jgi:hypothetical protein